MCSSRFFCAAALAALLSTGAACAAPSVSGRVGEAEVRLGEAGVPCFTVAEKEERRYGAAQFESIRVSDIGAREAAPMWSMEMPAGRSFPLMFSMCVPYAGRVASLPQRPAEMLVPGRLYEVQIAVRAGAALPAVAAVAAVAAVPTGPAIPFVAAPLRYVARFCLARQDDGRPSLRLLPPGTRGAAACTSAR